MKSKIDLNNWIVVLAMGGLAAAYGLLYFLPALKATNQLRQELATKEDFIAQAATLAAAVQATEQELAKTRAYNKAWEDPSPSETEVAALFGRINGLAKAAGAKTTRFDPEPASQCDMLKRIDLAVGCTGSFAQICKFLEDLESLPQEIWIENLRMENMGKSDDGVQCELSLAIFADNPGCSDQVTRPDNR